MRIAVVRQEYDPRRGGAERYARSLVGALAALGHETHVFSRRLPAAPAGVSGSGAGSGAAAGAGDPAIYHPVATPGWPTTRKNLAFARAVRDLLARWRFDAVIGLSPFWPQDVFRLGDGLAHAWAARDGRGLRRWAWRLVPRYRGILALERRILAEGQYRRLVLNSRLCRAHLAEHFPAALAHAVVVPNGVDAARFRPDPERRAAVRRRLGLTEEHRAILFVGANARRKGLPALVDAVGLLPEALRARVSVLVLGAPRRRYAPALQARARRAGWGPRLRWGTTDEPEQFYAAADCFCLPTRYDPMSNATLEALAAALPVVTTDADGAAELIADGVQGRVLAAPVAPAALAAAVQPILEDPVLARRLGAAGREAVRGRGWDEHARVLLAAIAGRPDAPVGSGGRGSAGGTPEPGTA